MAWKSFFPFLRPFGRTSVPTGPANEISLSSPISKWNASRPTSGHFALSSTKKWLAGTPER